MATTPHTVDDLITWLHEHQVTEVECIVSDMTGIARGKILPTDKFIHGLKADTLRLPEFIFGQTVTGSFIESEVLAVTEPDVVLRPDPRTVRLVPWYKDPTAHIISDAVDIHGAPVKVSPRYVLQRVLELFHQKNWQPFVAPEIEFYLVQQNVDPQELLKIPAGSSGRQETGRQSYGIDAVNEFDAIFEDMYDFCNIQNLDIDTLTHEAGAAQVEVNFNHGDALELADQIFLFKRTLRQVAMKHGVYATFMAKPFSSEPGSAFHIHQSVIDSQTGVNLFANEDGSNSDFFHHYIGGLQKYLPSAMALIAPNVNSYRRIMHNNSSAPINTHWGEENRTVGLRIPLADSAMRRVENRVPGADANPYIAFATSLTCGYLGVVNQIEPTRQMRGNAYKSKKHALPRHLLDALDMLDASPDLKEIMGEEFIQVFWEVKYAEHQDYQQVIPAWDRWFLLLNV